MRSVRPLLNHESPGSAGGCGHRRRLCASDCHRPYGLRHISFTPVFYYHYYNNGRLRCLGLRCRHISSYLQCASSEAGRNPLTSPTVAVLSEIGLPAPVREFASRSRDVIVAGAGHNGLARAAYLARTGKRVLVLESRTGVGVACTIEELFPGVHMSPCAYLAGLLLPLIVSELLVPFLDGSSVQLWDDDEACAAEVRRFAPGDVDGWRAMNDVIRRLRDGLRPAGDSDLWIGSSYAGAD